MLKTMCAVEGGHSSLLIFRGSMQVHQNCKITMSPTGATISGTRPRYFYSSLLKAL